MSHEARIAHVEANYQFWMDQYATHGDKFSEAQMHVAGKQMLAVRQNEAELNARIKRNKEMRAIA